MMDDASVLSLEEMSLNAWPSLQTQYFQGSLLRFAEGYTKRINSVNPLYFRGNIPDLIDYSEEQYEKRSLPVIFKILDLPKYGPLDQELGKRSYGVLDPSGVMIANLKNYNYPDHPQVVLEPDFSLPWIEGFIHQNHLDKKRLTVPKVLENIHLEKIVASLVVQGEIMGFGFAALENNQAGFYDILISQDHRGRGFGRMIMESLLCTAVKRRVEKGYLQVMDNNLPALKLYETLGFKPGYKYWYRIK